MVNSCVVDDRISIVVVDTGSCLGNEFILIDGIVEGGLLIISGLGVVVSALLFGNRNVNVVALCPNLPATL